MGLSLPAPTLTMQLFNITITIGIVYEVAAVVGMSVLQG